MLPTDTAYVCKNMYIWNTQKTQEYQICEMCVFSAVVVVLLRPYFFAELVGNVNTEKKKKQREANSSAGKECTVGSISLQARELTTLGEFRIPGKGSWQPHSSAAVRTNQGASPRPCSPSHSQAACRQDSETALFNWTQNACFNNIKLYQKSVQKWGYTAKISHQHKQCTC